MEIKLTGKRGGVAVVSEIDYKIVSKYAWYQNKEGYTLTSINTVPILMHQFIIRQYIFDIPKNTIVDHINKNRLDNRRDNLRLSVIRLNNQNKRLHKNKKSSTYKGVFYNKKQKKYHTIIGIDYENIYLGRYNTENEAAEVIDMYIVHNNYEHMSLNFPEKKMNI